MAGRAVADGLMGQWM